MAKHFLTATTVCSLLFVPLVVCAFDSVIEKYEKSFTVQDRARLEVKNDDGRTLIQATSGNQVLVEVTKEVLHARNEADAKKQADRVQIRLEQIGDRIEIVTIRPRWNFDLGNNPDVRTHFRISIPSNSDISTKTADGPVEISGIHGKLEISSADGEVTLSDCTGEIQINVGDGDVQATKCSGAMNLSLRDGDLKANDLDGQLVLKSSDGDVSVTAFRGKLEAASRDGEIQIDGAFTGLAARTSDGNLDITVQPGSVMEQDWGLRSRDGDIQLRLPDSFAADLSARCRDGEINTTIPITVSGSLSENVLTGKLNGGGYLLDIQSSDGDIQIVR